MTLLHTLFLAILQGASELFPVSSLGHAVVWPALLHWPLNEHAPGFLPFLVMLHLGTATALLTFFWQDWWALARGAVGLGSPHSVTESRRVLWLIMVATLPAVLVGFVLEHPLRRLFGAPMLVALMLVGNGILLALVEKLRSQSPRKPLSALSQTDALVIGAWQCLALIPGFSRSGATIAGGLLRGVDHEGAAHFSFLIATPIILGATVLEVPKLLHHGVAPGLWRLALIGAVVAGLVAWASTAFLMHWFKRDDASRLTPFAVYCVLFGLGAFGFLVVT